MLKIDKKIGGKRIMKGKKVQKEKNKSIEKKAVIGKNRMIASIVVSLIFVTLVIAAIIIYPKNMNVESFVYNKGIRISNEEIANKNNVSSMDSDENIDLPISNYVIAGSEEARKNEEILKLAELKSKQEETQIDNVKEEEIKYESQDVVKLASNTGNGNEIKNAVQTIAATSISGGTLTLSRTTYTYNGQRNVPNPTLKVGSQTLILGKDYTIEYTNNINAGTGKAIARGINSYTGTKEANFTISAKSIQVEVQGNTKFPYDGAEHKPAVKSPVTGENGDKVYLKVVVSDNKTAIDAGSYTAQVEIEKVEKGAVKAAPGTISVSSTVTTDQAGSSAAGNKVKKQTKLYIQITASQTNGTIQSVYSNGKYLTKNVNGKYYLEITENGTYGFAVVGSENTSKWYTVNVTNYLVSHIPEKLEVGDYVKYTPDITASVSWRVWKIDEENDKVIIAPTSNLGSLGLIGPTGDTGWENAETAIENECDKYISNSLGITATDIRSMKIEDIEKVLPVTEVANAKEYCSYGTEKTCTSGMLYAAKAAAGEATFDGYNKDDKGRKEC